MDVNIPGLSLRGWTPGRMQSKPRLITQSNPQEAIDVGTYFPQLVWKLRIQAALVWVVLPLFLFIQNSLPGVEPSCSSGYSDVCLMGLLVVVIWHIYAESSSWAICKELVTRPELAVMRQLGVLGKRRFYVILGILEELGLYSNFAFPWVARSCRLDLSEELFIAWSGSTELGSIVYAVLQYTRFWGICLILVSLVILQGLFGLVRIRESDLQTALERESRHQRTAAEEETPALASLSTLAEDVRIPGEVFLLIADQANTALMPSIAYLCEEIAMQKRFTFHDKENSGGSLGTQLARESAVLGKMPKEYVQQFELVDNSVLESVESATKFHYMIMFLLKVILAGAIQVWMQAAFFEVAFPKLGVEATYKQLLGMLVCAILITKHAGSCVLKAGIIGVFYFLITVWLLTWAGALVYHAFECEQHLWTALRGCVDYQALMPTPRPFLNAPV